MPRSTTKPRTPTVKKTPVPKKKSAQKNPRTKSTVKQSKSSNSKSSTSKTSVPRKTRQSKVSETQLKGTKKGVTATKRHSTKKTSTSTQSGKNVKSTESKKKPNLRDISGRKSTVRRLPKAKTLSIPIHFKIGDRVVQKGCRDTRWIIGIYIGRERGNPDLQVRYQLSSFFYLPAEELELLDK